jgi:hypothetical protein
MFTIPAMTAKPSDRRRAPRAPMLMSVEYESVGSTESAETIDVSRSGLFLGTRTPLPVGTELSVRLKPKGTLRVRVMRVVEGDPTSSRTPGMGVRILDSDETTTLALANHLARSPRRRVEVTLVGEWPAPVPAVKVFRSERATAQPKPPASNAAKEPERNEARKGGKKKHKHKNGKRDLFGGSPEE